MPKFNGVNYKKTIQDAIIVDECPYCCKKILNKKSYRNHIVGGYCTMCDIKTGKSIELEIPLNCLKGENDE